MKMPWTTPKRIRHCRDLYLAIAKKVVETVKNSPWPRQLINQTNCKAIADVIVERIGGTKFQLQNRLNPVLNKTFTLGRVKLAGQTSILEGWLDHWVVVKDGRVYDGFTGAGGLTIAEFKAQFIDGVDIAFGF